MCMQMVVTFAILVSVVHAYSGIDLYNAAKEGDLAGVTAALAAGVNPNWQEDRWGNSALHRAAFNNDQVIMKVLLNGGADKDIRTHSGMTPLFVAAHDGHTDIVAILINAGADVDISDRYRWTPLISASAGGHLSTVETLIAAQANLKLKTDRGTTALAIATERNHSEVANILLKADTENM